MFKPEQNTIQKAATKYRLLMISVFVYYITDAIWGILAGLNWIPVLFLDTTLYYIAMASAIVWYYRYIVECLEMKGLRAKFFTYFGDDGTKKNEMLTSKSCRATGTPSEMPVITKVKVIIMCAPFETAETAAASQNCPMIIKSTEPYIVCKNIAKRIGKANRKSGSFVYLEKFSSAFNVVWRRFSKVFSNISCAVGVNES